MIARFLIAPFAMAAVMICEPAPPAHADVCVYPGVGVGAQVLVGRGAFCDYPMEINGSHLHCEGGGLSIGGSGSYAGDSGSIGVGGMGIGGASCSWRCPDGVLSPAPNPPGMWRNYIAEPVKTGWCVTDGHMTPNGLWSEPVRPEEGIPPEEPPKP